MPRFQLPIRLLALAALFSATPVMAACLDRARTPLEKAYCQVVEEGQGSGLPSFEDFRRNTPRVQALLLKRPGSRAGVEVPKAEPEPGSAPEAVSESEASPPEPSEEPPGLGGLSGCELAGERITCPGGDYRLTGNQPNRSLPPGALEPDNRLNLPSFSGDPQDKAAVQRYLSKAYDRYIPKMLAIGLGGATMSFSEFYHRFWRHQRHGVDFAQRLEQTYQLLKEDKRSKAVADHLHDRLPERLEHCARIGADIIVCDDVATNWVYVSTP